MSDLKCARVMLRAAERDVLTLRSMTGEAPGEWYFAGADAIRAAEFNRSASRQLRRSRTKVEQHGPLETLGELRAIETEISGEHGKQADVIRGISST